jgi:hypothetical protein
VLVHLFKWRINLRRGCESAREWRRVARHSPRRWTGGQRQNAIGDGWHSRRRRDQTRTVAMWTFAPSRLAPWPTMLRVGCEALACMLPTSQGASCQSRLQATAFGKMSQHVNKGVFCVSIFCVWSHSVRDLNFLYSVGVMPVCPCCFSNGLQLHIPRSGISPKIGREKTLELARGRGVL